MDVIRQSRDFAEYLRLNQLGMGSDSEIGPDDEEYQDDRRQGDAEDKEHMESFFMEVCTTA